MPLDAACSFFFLQFLILPIKGKVDQIENAKRGNILMIHHTIM
jgi:hypothetical protein